MPSKIFANMVVVVAALAGAASSQTTVGGPITSDTTWTAGGSPYVVTSSILIGNGATLTIQPGVTVQMGSGLGISVGFTGLGAGTLIARGTAQSPILFTSSAKMAGAWGYIRFTSSAVSATLGANSSYASGSILEYCTIEFGGDKAMGAVELQKSAPYLHACTIRDSAANGIYASGDSGVPAPGLQMRDCVVQQCAASGLELSSVGPCEVAANVVDHCGSSFFNDYGIFVIATSAHVQGNIVHDCETGIYASSGAALLHNQSRNNANAGFEGSFDSAVGDQALSNGQDGFDISNNKTLDGVVARANQGRGIYLLGSANIRNALVMDNTGGGVYFNGGGSLGDSLVARNGSQTAVGGGVRFTSNIKTLTVSNCHIVENVAMQGGGIYGYYSGLTVTNTELALNTAADGGGMYLYGGAIAGDPQTGDHNTFLGNSAGRGDDIYFAGPSGTTLDASYTCFAGPATLSDPNQIWDFFDDSNLGLVLTGNPVMCDPFADVGAAVGGPSGAPLLQGQGPLTPGTAATWSVSQGQASAPGLMILALASGYSTLPPFPGIIVPQLGPATAQIALTLDGSGNAHFTIPKLGANARGTQVWAQAFLLDGTAPGGIAFSNALVGVVP